MSLDWIDQIEKELDEKFAQFLQTNPYQDELFNKQSQKDLFQKN